MALVGLRFIDPPTTGVQIQRRVESWFPQTRWRKIPYQKRQQFVSLDKISIEVQHAVIASEDGNYYKHHGVDWTQVQKVAEQSAEKGRVVRGASTIEQQLVKNLFFTTHRNPFRKAFEYTLAPLADTILGKRRALELYLNVVEWGPGVWGIQAAAQYHYHTTAAKLDREQAARLAACLPSPRRYRPAIMNDFSASIQDRMRMLGW
ncbi:MAG: monofunctional biosynthetic peptidoglycan transglycosylase [Bryobacteraceae bacterium]